MFIFTTLICQADIVVCPLAQLGRAFLLLYILANEGVSLCVTGCYKEWFSTQ